MGGSKREPVVPCSPSLFTNFPFLIEEYFEAWVASYPCRLSQYEWRGL